VAFQQEEESWIVAVRAVAELKLSLPPPPSRERRFTLPGPLKVSSPSSPNTSQLSAVKLKVSAAAVPITKLP
jgi:hypothetical protein